jgi:hypothetical protein
MEEVARMKPPSSQPLLESQQQPALEASEMMEMKKPSQADCNVVENPEIISASSDSNSSCEQRLQPVLSLHDKRSNKAYKEHKEEACMDLRTCCSCYKRRTRTLRRRGVRMYRSVCTTRVQVAVTAAREAVKSLAVEELGVFGRALAGLTEWMQVISLSSKLISLISVSTPKKTLHPIGSSFLLTMVLQTMTLYTMFLLNLWWMCRLLWTRSNHS